MTSSVGDIEASVPSSVSLSDWIIILCFILITIQLLRISIDIIQYVSILASNAAEESTNTTTNTTISTTTTTPKDKGKNMTTNSISTTASSSMKTYGSINSSNENDVDDVEATQQQQQPLIVRTTTATTINSNSNSTTTTSKVQYLLCIHYYVIMAVLYVIIPLLMQYYFNKSQSQNEDISLPLSSSISNKIRMITYSTSIIIILEIYFLYIDRNYQRYGYVQHTLHIISCIVLWMTYAILYTQTNTNTTSTSSNATTTSYQHFESIQFVLLVLSTIYVIGTISIKGYYMKYFHNLNKNGNNIEETNGDIDTMKKMSASSSSSKTKKKRKQLSWSAIYILVKPYVWPDMIITKQKQCTTTGSSSPAAVAVEYDIKKYTIINIMNRLRAIGTWVCVIVSKYCTIICPIYLGKASTALAHADYYHCIYYTILYNVISWFGTTFKEGQSLMYLKVKQAAFIQLSQTAFYHLHTLSLDWHLQKKLGEVLRSMDRGISACDTVMNYLFLWLLPAIIECIVVCIIFATYFQYIPLAITVFYFVFFYIAWTIVLTVWRKKFRKALVLHDNEWHDRFTDSMINFETVKFFTAEMYELQRFTDSVRQYQDGSVNVQSSLSILNISQQFILKLCLTTALALSAIGIQKRINCCVETIGCDSGISDCCLNVSQSICPGMQVGDFVAVLTYTLSLFAPLNFLGSVYNSIVMAMVDLGNMSELLAETPDITDAADAMALPPINTTNPDIAIEFDNVTFNYPTQPKERGLKGLSFKIKRGTTTAIVGPTGAGKTTVSRLLFRFYDVLGGAVKVNGIDVRSLQQDSLRGAIGVVPQAASMFNDTIRNNILYGRRDATEAEVIQAATDAQLIGFIESLDDGWETLVGDRGLKLSGGEKQRAAIARCLLKNPPFILLDEATASLDTLTENSVQVALDRLGAQRTVVVIAHRLGTIRNADKIIVLKDGRAFEEGTHDELLLKNGLYAEMWNMQLHSTSTTTSQSNLLSV